MDTLNPMRRLLLLAALAATVAGCATKSGPIGPKPVVKSIEIIPATLPTYYSLQNLSAVQFLVPIAALGYSMNSKEKAKQLTERLPAATFRIDDQLTNTVAELLRQKGYAVSVLSDAKRRPDSPDWFDYEQVPHSADALIHVYFSDVGVESPRSTTDYIPRMNVSVMSYTKQNKGYPYETTIYYGVDAKAGTEYSVVADPKHLYPDFDFMLNNLETVRENFKGSVKLVAERIAAQLHAALQ